MEKNIIFKLLYIVKMTDDIEFTLAVQACGGSDTFKLLVNLFSTLYTGWISENNIRHVRDLFVSRRKYMDIMREVLAKMKDEKMIDSSQTKLSMVETIKGAIKLLGGRAIKNEELQYKTEILVVTDLYFPPPNTILPKAFKEGSIKVKPEERKRDGSYVVLPDGMFGMIGDQKNFMDIPSSRQFLAGLLRLYKQEIDILGLSEKISSIRIIYPHNNYGIAMMRTISIQECRGRMLAMIDDDDISCGLDSLHRIGKTMLENNKYIAETQSWWNNKSEATIGTGLWERVFDARMLKKYGICLCPTFSHGEDDVFLMIMRMLFADKIIKIATDGTVIVGKTKYPKDKDLKYVYSIPSESWKPSSVAVTGILQRREISIFLKRLCLQLGIFDALSKAIPSNITCGTNMDIKFCAGYDFIHMPKLEVEPILSTGDIICVIYLYKLVDGKIVKDGDHNVKYIYAMPSPEKEETVSFTTDIPATEDIKNNVIDHNLENRINYTEEGNLIVTGKLQPRSSSIDENTGTVSYDGIEMNWVEWNNNIYNELVKASTNERDLVAERTRLRGGANRSYIIFILIALIIVLLIIIPIICKCLCNKDDGALLPESEDYQL